MKYFLLIALTLSADLLLAQKINPKTDAALMNLKGPVKSIREQHFAAAVINERVTKGDRITSPSSMNLLYEFDQAGNKIAETWFTQDNAVETVYRSKFIKPGLVSEQAVYEGSNLLKSRREIEYDQNNNKTVVTNYSKDERLSGKFTNKYIITDDHHYYFETINKGGDVIHSDSVVTDAQHNLLMNTHLAGTDYTKTMYYYKAASPNPYLIKTFSRTGLLTYQTAFEYDKNGNKVKETSADNLRKTTTTSNYTYDSKGNWTKRIDRDGTNVYIIERVIVYY